MNSLLKCLLPCYYFKLVRLFLVLLFFTFISNLFGQSRIQSLIEGKEFRNSQTGLIFSYGYISNWNTYGIIMTNKHGTKYYYINCSTNIASDGQSMTLYSCTDLEGNTVGVFYVYPRRVIQVLPDELPGYGTNKFIFEPIEYKNNSNVDETNNEPNDLERVIWKQVLFFGGNHITVTIKDKIEFINRVAYCIKNEGNMTPRQKSLYEQSLSNFDDEIKKNKKSISQNSSSSKSVVNPTIKKQTIINKKTTTIPLKKQ